MTARNLESLVSLCKRRGFVQASCAQYTNGLAGSFDYAPRGAALKHNISEAWRATFVRQQRDVHPLDTPIILHPLVWQKAGHVAQFADPVLVCRKCGASARVDDERQEAERRATACEACGEKDAFDGSVQQRNLMLQSAVGSVRGAQSVYLRPETAQGVFAAAAGVIQSMNINRLPFGLAQSGTAFRNEINPANFLFRMREFEQLELEYFCAPDAVEQALRMWRDVMRSFLVEQLRLPATRLRELTHVPADAPIVDESLQVRGAHYAGAGGLDFQYRYPFGWSELCGLANRGSHDTTAHNVSVVLTDSNGSMNKIVPHVVEPSFGLDRLLLATLDAAWQKQSKAEHGVERDLLALPFALAPVKAAILPMRKSQEMLDTADKLLGDMLPLQATEIDITGSIGKRYRRFDEIGTPYCITIDPQSLEDNSFTIRERDSMSQIRLSKEQLIETAKQNFENLQF